ncbi:MAG: tetratricopeptide repeat protein [Chitinophagales bacterium]
MKIFFSYAREDAILFRDFEQSLAVLKEFEKLEFSHSQMTLPHENSEETISKAMQQANLIFVLMSSDYFASATCQKELEKAMQWHKQNEKIMLCLLLKPCLWDIGELQDFQILPDNEKAVTTWENIDEVHRNIALSLKNVIDKHNANIDYEAIDVETHQKLLQSNNQLVNYPRLQIPLFGRKKELKKFEQFFVAHSHLQAKIISIEGLGGIGKRPFIAACIQEYIKDKNRIIWLDADEDTTFNDFVEQAGYGFLLQNNKKSRSKYVALKTHLEAENKILFWNNFQDIQDKEFIDFLLAISTTLEHLQIIIISRFKPILNLPIASIQLHGLNKKQALQYASYVQGMDSDFTNIPQKEIESLCECTHGHTLSIQLGMELLGYGETAETVFETLKSHGHLYDNLLKAVFNHLETKPKSKELLLQMSVFQQKITDKAIESITDVNNVKSILYPLIYKNILSITRSSSGTLYELHPLVKHFCYHLLADKMLIHARAAAYFLQKREKLPNIAVEKQIFYHLEKSEQFDKIGDTIKLFGEALIGRGQHSFLEEMLETIKDKGFDIGLYQLLVGKIYNAKGNWKAAYQCFLQACKVSKNSEVMIEAYLNMSMIFQRQGKIQKALECCDNVEKYLNKKDIPHLRALLFLHKNSIYLHLGEWEKATFFYIEGMQVCEKLEDITTQISLLQNMGILLQKQGDLKNAMLKYEEALEKSKHIKDDKLMGKVLNSMGGIYLRKNDLGKALKYFKMSLKAKENASDIVGISNTKVNVGIIEYEKGDYKKSLITFEKAIDLTRSLGNKKALSTVFYSIGKVLIEQGKIKAALENYHKALSLKQEFQDKRGIADLHHNISKTIFNLQKTKFQTALHYNLNALLGFYQLGSKHLGEAIDEYKKITSVLEERNVFTIEQEFMLTLGEKERRSFSKLKIEKIFSFG